MNETFLPRLADADGMHDNDPAPAEAKADLSVHRGAGRSCAKALAGIFTAVMLGCSATGGGGEGSDGGIGAVQGAASSRNIAIRQQQIAQQQAQQQAQQKAVLEARREAALEARRNAQAASDRLVLKQEQEKVQRQAQEQRQRQQAQQQGNQGQGPQGNQGKAPNIPPGQAKKQ